VEFLVFAYPLLAIAGSGGGGTNLVLLFSALGGLSGLAALATVFINWRANTRKAEQEDKSVAIVELEKAVPGLGNIIREWQAVVHQLQDDLTLAKSDLAEAKNRGIRLDEELELTRSVLAETQQELADCRSRLTELERGHTP
jgi:chromosome segregation ATPase